MNVAAARATLRIARRDALRSKGRSLLVITMIALPVLGMSTIDVLARTAQLSPQEKASRQLGRADLAVQAVPSGLIDRQDGGGAVAAQPASGRGSGEPLPADAVRALLPAGSRAISDGRGSIRVRTEAGVTRADVRELDYAAPLATGIVRQRGGREPRTMREVDVSPRLLDVAGLRVGGTLRTDGASYTIVGTAIEPDSTSGREVFALPGAVLAGGDVGLDRYGPPRLLVALPGGVGAGAVERSLNTRGVVLQTRERILHPPPGDARIHAETVGAVTVVVGLAALEVILLAGAAFAVGARRARRELGLLTAVGGDRSQVRGVVLGGGVVLGIAGAIAGVAIGVPLAAAGRPLLEHFSGGLFGAFDVRPLELTGIAIFGLVTGVLAAVLPARTAARTNVVDALTGRRGVVATRKRVPLLGLSAVGVGALITAYGASRSSFNVILLGAVVCELGFVACAPALVGLVGWPARLLPLAPRLALRDASRHRSRTGPAVAAIMAALSGSIAISVYLVSDQAHNEANYHLQLRPGQAQLYYGGPEVTNIDQEAVTAVADALPTRAAAYLRVSEPYCDRQPDCRPVSLEVPTVNRCPLSAGRASFTRAQVRRLEERDPRCAPRAGRVGIGVGGPDLLHALTGRAGAAAVAALARGDVLVFSYRFSSGSSSGLSANSGSGAPGGNGGQMCTVS